MKARRRGANNNTGAIGISNTNNQRDAVLQTTAALNGVKSVSVGGSAVLAVVPSTTRPPSMVIGWGGPNARVLFGEPPATTVNALRPILLTRW